MGQIKVVSTNNNYILKEKRKVYRWINNLCLDYGFHVKHLNIVFMNDEELLEVNKSYLNHEYYTDIITFDLSENKHEIEGELYISYDRVTENSQIQKTRIQEELKRIIIHGILHLIGFNDKNKRDKALMTEKEDLALIKFSRETNEYDG